MNGVPLNVRVFFVRLFVFCNSLTLCKWVKYPFLTAQAVKGSSEDLLNLITMRIEQALQRWDADKIGIPDYALESAGKSVQGVYKNRTYRDHRAARDVALGEL